MSGEGAKDSAVHGRSTEAGGDLQGGMDVASALARVRQQLLVVVEELQLVHRELRPCRERKRLSPFSHDKK